MAVVVGYIPTDEGRAALSLAADEALLRDARLIVVLSHQLDDPSTPEAAKRYKSKREEIAQELEKELSVDFEPIRERFQKARATYEIRTMVPSSDPSTDLNQVAAEVGAAFIVIGMRRRSAVGKLILGSNAQRILLDAPCPVIAVPATPAN